METPSSQTKPTILKIKFWLWDFGFKPIIFFLIVAIIFNAFTFPSKLMSVFLTENVSDSILIKNFVRLITILVSIFTANFFVFIFLKKQTFQQSPVGLSNLGKDLFNGFLLGAGIFSVVIFVSWLIGIYSVTGFYWDTHSSLETFIFILSNLLFFLSVGLSEEYIYRAGMVHIFEDSWGTWVALIVSSLIFGFSHLGNPHATLRGAIAITIEAGFFLGSAYLLTRKIWFVVGIHWAWNYFQGPVLGTVISGSSAAQEGLLMSNMNGSDWLTGGIFGPEAGIPAMVICTSAGIYYLVKTYKAGLFKKSIL